MKAAPAAFCRCYNALSVAGNNLGSSDLVVLPFILPELERMGMREARRLDL